MHPYLRERLRDLRNHGFCIIEKDLIMEDETIWGGHSHDLFNEAVVKHFDGKPFLMEDQPNGDLLIKEPKTQEEWARAIVLINEMINEEITEQAFGEEGALGRKGLVH